MENGLIYLDNAATTFPKPDAMHEAVHNFYKNYGVNPGRSGPNGAQPRGPVSSRM